MADSTDRSPFTKRQQQFLAAIRAGHTTRPELARLLGGSVTAAHDMIQRLEAKGAVKCTGRDTEQQGHPRTYTAVELAPEGGPD